MMYIFAISIAVCFMSISHAVDKPLECSSKLTHFSSTLGGQNASVGVNISVKFNNLQASSRSVHQFLEVNASNSSYSVNTVTEDSGGGFSSFDRILGNAPVVCVSLDTLGAPGTEGGDVTASCYQRQESYSLAARLLQNTTPSELQISVNSSEWMNVCQEDDNLLDQDTMVMICKDLGYRGLDKTEHIVNEHHSDDSIVLLCPTNSLRIADCRATVGRCGSHKFTTLTCQTNIKSPFGITWSIFTLSLVSATACLFFMLMVSLIVHFCRCCRRKRHSEVLVTYVKKNKSSFRKDLQENTDILIPTITYDEADKALMIGSGREKDVKGSSEGLYMDIPDCTLNTTKGETIEQIYQVDEDGYAKPRNVIGANTSVKIPEEGPETNQPVSHVTKPVKSPKPILLSRNRKDSNSPDY